MDFYLKVIFVILGIIVAATLIYMFTTNAQLSFNFLGIVSHKVHGDMESVFNYDLDRFDNTRAVSGTVILPLIRDVGSHDLAVFVQTRAQNGVVVNYGVQLRGSREEGDLNNARANNTSAGELEAWERAFVFSTRSFFGRANFPALGDLHVFSGAAADNRPNTASVNGIQTVYLGPNPARVGRTAGGAALFTPTVAFWNPINTDIAAARRLGETYSTTGRLYTAQYIIKAMERNHNALYAETPGSPYYINMTSQFHSVLIENESGVIIGIYFEEHGVHDNSNLLARAQIETRMFAGALPHN